MAPLLGTPGRRTTVVCGKQTTRYHLYPCALWQTGTGQEVLVTRVSGWAEAVCSSDIGGGLNSLDKVYLSLHWQRRFALLRNFFSIGMKVPIKDVVVALVWFLSFADSFMVMVLLSRSMMALFP